MVLMQLAVSLLWFAGLSLCQNCGGRLTMPNGEIASPNYPNLYNDNVECIWVVIVPDGAKISLRFTDLALENSSTCSYDYVQINDGEYNTSPSLGRFCGITVPSAIISNSNKLYLTFRTDGSVTSRGFRATFSGCGGNFIMSSGVITSQNFPNFYNNNINCVWVVSVPYFQRVSLLFSELDTESCCDIVQINDGGVESAPRYGDFSGSTPQSAIISSSNRLYLWFRTDSSVTRSGFRAYFSAVSSPPTLQLVLTSYNALGWSWSRGSKIYDGWNLYFNNTPENITDQATLSKTYTGLGPDTSYTFSIRCYEIRSNISRYGDWTNITSKTDEAVPGPVNIRSHNSTNDSISVTWSEPSNPGGVIVYYVLVLTDSTDQRCINKTVVTCLNRVGKNVNYQLKISQISPICKYEVNTPSSCNQYMYLNYRDLHPYTNYSVMMYAINSKDPSVVNLTILTRESAPLDSPIWYSSIISSFWVMVSWSKVNDTQGKIERYQMHYSINNLAVMSSTQSHNITGLTPYTSYSLIIRACNSAGCGPFSRVLNINTSQSAPSGGPQNLSVINVGSSFVYLTWNEINKNESNGIIRGYVIRYTTVEETTTSTSANITGLAPNTEYTFYVFGYCFSETQEILAGVKEANLTVMTEEGEPILKEMNQTFKNEISKSVKTETKTIRFELPAIEDIFSSAAGSIGSFQLLVISQTDNTNFRDNLQPETWAKSREKQFREPYAPFVGKNLSELFQDATQKQIMTVGNEECDSAASERICNGPLEPGTKYCIYVRGWTNGGYTDTYCIVSGATKSDHTLVIAGSATAGVVLIGLITLAAGCLRRRSRKNKDKVNNIALNTVPNPTYSDSALGTVQNNNKNNNEGNYGEEDQPVYQNHMVNADSVNAVQNVSSDEIDYDEVPNPSNSGEENEVTYENCIISRPENLERINAQLYENVKY